MGEDQDLPRAAGEPVADAPGALVDLRRGLAARTVVQVDLPARPFAADLRRGQALVAAVVVLPELGQDGDFPEARQLGGAPGTLEVAGVDGGEVDAAQAGAQPAGLLLPLRQQG